MAAISRRAPKTRVTERGCPLLPQTPPCPASGHGLGVRGARGLQGNGNHSTWLCLSQQHPHYPQPTELFFVRLIRTIIALVKTCIATEKCLGATAASLLQGQIFCSPMFCKRNTFQLGKTSTVWIHTTFSHTLNIQWDFTRHREMLNWSDSL